MQGNNNRRNENNRKNENSKNAFSKKAEQKDKKNNNNKKTNNGNKKTSKYAYVTMVINGDKYINGAIGLAKGLLITKTKCDLVCMIDNTVSQKGVSRLREVFDYVPLVDRIYKETGWGHKKATERYSSWWKFSFTKWRCLTMTQYKKVLFLDADVSVIKNIDNLFEMKAPAGVFSPALFRKNLSNDKHTEDELEFGILAHGEEVDIKKRLTHPTWISVATGGCILLEPSCYRFCKLLNILCSVEEYKFDIKKISGTDEISIAQAFGDVLWYNIDNIYHYRAGSSESPERINKRDTVRALHYLNEKPWEIPENNKRRSIYYDVKLWWDIFDVPITIKNRNKISNEEYHKIQTKIQDDFKIVYDESFERNWSNMNRNKRNPR